MTELTKKSRMELLDSIASILDTRDKRFMFLKLEFPRLVSRINLEGSSDNVAWNFYEEFRKQCMLGSLIATFNGKFETDLILELNE